MFSPQSKHVYSFFSESHGEDADVYIHTHTRPYLYEIEDVTTVWLMSPLFGSLWRKTLSTIDRILPVKSWNKSKKKNEH
jgi:hypothetical protein